MARPHMNPHTRRSIQIWTRLSPQEMSQVDTALQRYNVERAAHMAPPLTRTQLIRRMLIAWSAQT